MRVINAPEVAEKLRPLTSVLQEKEIPNGIGKRFARYVEVDQELVTDLFSRFGLTWAKKELTYGNFIGNHFVDGVYVPTHKDEAPKGFQHVRCNVAIKLPQSGGRPVLGGEHLDINEGDVWVCFASIEEHSSTPTQGGERIIFSIGGLVEEAEAIAAYERIKKGN